MGDWAEIRRLHRAEGLPIKAIVRLLGVSRNMGSELDDPDHAEVLAHLRVLTEARLTLLTATRDPGISHARVLAERLS